MSRMFSQEYWVKPSPVTLMAMHIIVPSPDNPLVPQNNQYCPFPCLSRCFQVAVSKCRNLSRKFLKIITPRCERSLKIKYVTLCNYYVERFSTTFQQRERSIRRDYRSGAARLFDAFLGVLSRKFSEQPPNDRPEKNKHTNR